MKRILALALAILCLCAVPADAHTPKRIGLWVRIGRCEQPGPGKWGIWWSFKGSTYSGGLGFYNPTWLAYAPKKFPNNAGDANWKQQMVTANILYDLYGGSPWGCY
jgi:hypothetical protein